MSQDTKPPQPPQPPKATAKRPALVCIEGGAGEREYDPERYPCLTMRLSRPRHLQAVDERFDPEGMAPPIDPEKPVRF